MEPVNRIDGEKPAAKRREQQRGGLAGDARAGGTLDTDC
jgi:hypothetical protein